MMNYEEARKYMSEAEVRGSILGLERMRKLMEELHNPQDRIPMIHVAGTNGKGSTIAYLCSILQSAGYRVGRYNSPSVFSYLEKYSINGIEMSEERFAQVTQRVKGAADCLKVEEYPTVFELETAVAYEFFYEEQCDIAVIETGMGGAEDATNVIAHPLACVFTSISLDHVGILGNTVEEIADTKAGIIVDNGAVIVQASNRENESVIRRIGARCKAFGGELYKVGKAYDIVYGEASTAFSYDGQRYDTGMLGVFQVENACNAIETAHILSYVWREISDRAIYDGIRNAMWAGRFEVVNKTPLVVLDGAHNPDAACRLRETLTASFSHKKKIIIFGMLKDKDYVSVVQTIGELAEEIYTLTPHNPRGLAAEELAKECEKVCEQVYTFGEDRYDMAIRQALERVDRKNGMILVCGTLSFLREVKEILV